MPPKHHECIDLTPDAAPELTRLQGTTTYTSPAAVSALSHSASRFWPSWTSISWRYCKAADYYYALDYVWWLVLGCWPLYDFGCSHTN